MSQIESLKITKNLCKNGCAMQEADLLASGLCSNGQISETERAHAHACTSLLHALVKSPENIV